MKHRNPVKCVCGRKAEVVQNEDGRYEVECTRCGKTSGSRPKLTQAVWEWNRPKDLADMIGKEGMASVYAD